MDEIVAYHEAGHAFTAVYLGAQVRYVTLEPHLDDQPRREGEAQIAWRRSRLSPKEFQNKLVLVALGGPAAEAIYCDAPFHPAVMPAWRGDWDEAWQAAGEIHPHETTRLRFVEEAMRQLLKLQRLDEHWAAIAALADELLAHETLEAEQVHEVLGFWMR